MSIAPRYSGKPVITLEGEDGGVLIALARQRRRLGHVLEGLEPHQWGAASRCAGWTVQDVVAHLADVNSFWTASVRAGLEGHPTSMLSAFDPASTPELLVALRRGEDIQKTLERYDATSEELVAILEGLADGQWQETAEAPPGHLSITSLAHHALWDAWIHERDLCIPLGLDQPSYDDEVGHSLVYACALSAAIVVLTGHAPAGAFVVAALDPDVRCTLDVADSVVVTPGVSTTEAPVLRGDAVALAEVVSTRVPRPDDVPAEWATILDGLKLAFAVHS